MISTTSSTVTSPSISCAITSETGFLVLILSFLTVMSVLVSSSGVGSVGSDSTTSSGLCSVISTTSSTVISPSTSCAITSETGFLVLILRFLTVMSVLVSSSGVGCVGSDSTTSSGLCSMISTTSSTVTSPSISFSITSETGFLVLILRFLTVMSVLVSSTGVGCVGSDSTISSSLAIGFKSILSFETSSGLCSMISTTSSTVTSPSTSCAITSETGFLVLILRFLTVMSVLVSSSGVGCFGSDSTTSSGLCSMISTTSSTVISPSISFSITSETGFLVLILRFLTVMSVLVSSSRVGSVGSNSTTSSGLCSVISTTSSTVTSPSISFSITSETGFLVLILRFLTVMSVLVSSSGVGSVGSDSTISSSLA